MDHSAAPILDALVEYRRLDRYGFTPPAHRQGRGIDPRVTEILGLDPFRGDVLASSGLDDRASSAGHLQLSQDLMADAVGAEHAFYSTCGSSLSVKAAILGVTRGRGELIIGRDAHKSAAAGLVLSGLQPRWVSPSWDPELHLAHPPSPASIQSALDHYPDASAVFITSPTPYGTCADIASIAELCHSRGKPLIVDEAWGAHLPFHDGLPTWAMSAGADVCVVSVHKMGMGFEQGSVYHVQGPLVDVTHLKQSADVLATTSANVLIYAAIDGWRRQMVQDGTRMLGAALDRARDVRTRIEEIGGLRVMERELLGAEASHDLDPLHVLIDVSQLRISGYQAADWLRAERAIDMGINDHRRVEATLSMADDDTTADRLLAALNDLADASESLDAPAEMYVASPEDLELESVMLPRDAFFGDVEDIPVAQAAGRIAAEQVTPYPPGIPAILPGERISQGVLDYLESGVKAGMVLPDPADATLSHLRVVKE